MMEIRTKTEESGTTSYTYDDLGRLTEAQLADGTLQQYTFDGNGNPKTMTVTKDGVPSVTEYVYDLNDRLITETKDGVTTSYSYDDNGNMLGKSDGTSVVTQTFDLLNRMTAYTDGETIASYTYNPDNMRRSKSVNGVKTEHIWVGSEIALDITRGSVVSYMQGIKSDYGWYVYNAHGDVVQLCDDNGVVIRSYDYDPYGNQLTEADALDKNPYRYSGEFKVASGCSGKPLPSESVHPELLNRASKVGEYGEKTIYGNRHGVCAEFMSANKLTNNGSRIQNIRFTLALRHNNKGVSVVPTCDNCKDIFPEALKWITRFFN